jgi:hypothetical protein
VFFDQKMILSDHIEKTIMKAYRSLGFVLRVCKPFSELAVIKVVYFAYVRSILEYISPIWSPQYTTYKERLEKIQKIFINHLNFRYRKPINNYIDDCMGYKLLPLERRRKVLDMGFLHDIINSKIDCPHLLSKITFRTPTYRTRNTPLLHIPRCRTNYLQNSVLLRLARTYNDCFKDIDLFTNNKHKFKTEIVKVLMGTK